MSFLFKSNTGIDHKRSDHNNETTMNDRDPLDQELCDHFAFRKPNLSISDFEVGTTLGTGTFGRVKLAKYSYSNYDHEHVLALKILKKKEVARLRQVDHINSERRILSGTSHPFIVKLYGTFQDEKMVYMMMNYVIGGELFTYLRERGRLGDFTAKIYTAEIILALEHLHHHNIVYRDLKPENILIDKDGHICITDFGFAKVVDDRTWTLCGTPEYLAPEIIQSKGHDFAVDWWALGILIYEMLAGYPPFFDENPFGIYQKILSGRLEFPQHIDPDARDLIARLLQHDKSKRLGCLYNKADGLKQHKWFKGVNWEDILQRKVQPPLVPRFDTDEDTCNFDTYEDSVSDETSLLSGFDNADFVEF